MFKLRKTKGQGLVEFALILPALLLILFSIIEGGLLFQAYLAVQHASREAARWAAVYQPPITYSIEQGERLLNGLPPGSPQFSGETDEHWNLRRTQYIRDRALEQFVGIRVVYPATGFFENHSGVDPTYTRDATHDLRDRPGFFGVRVWGFANLDANPPVPQIDHPSLPGLPVRVRVEYRWVPIDPLIRMIAPNGVLLTGESIMINEGIQVGKSAVVQPVFPTDTPLVGGTVGAATPTPTRTSTVTPSAPPTPTTTPTATPSGPYLVLQPPQNRWLRDEWDTPAGVYPQITIELHNHPNASGPYQLFWSVCGSPDVSLNYVPALTTNSNGYRSVPARSASEVGTSFAYLGSCEPVTPGTTYTATLKSKTPGGVQMASIAVPIYIPYQRPDLIIQGLNFSPSQAMTQGGAFLMGVQVKNVGQAPITGTFDVDVYFNPTHQPILPGLPGIGTSGGSAPKQWWTIPNASPLMPGSSIMVTFTAQLPSNGDHSIWAQVDTSDLIDESNDNNNIYGPLNFSFPCGQASDNFSGNLSKWVLPITVIGTGSCSGCYGNATIDQQTLVINGTGANIWQLNEGRFYFLNQGPYPGNFDMRVQILQRPNRADAKTGLMVRETTTAGARYVAIAVDYVGGTQMSFRSFARLTTSQTSPSPSCTSSIASQLFDGNLSNGEGVWVRIVRNGNMFTTYTSVDGSSWGTLSCSEVIFTSAFSDPALPGIFMAPY